MAGESAWRGAEGVGVLASDVRPSGEPARRFAEIVKLNGLGTRMIDRAQERRLLEDGINRYGLTLDEARGLLRTVAEDNGYAFESQTGRRIQQMLARDAGKSGRISKRQFNRAAEMLRDFSDDAVSAADARRQVKRIMVENGWAPARAGWLRGKAWFRRIDA